MSKNSDSSSYQPEKDKDNRITINIIPYKTEIRHIYHISDLHIHLYKRHQEYELIFEKVLNYLREERRVNKIKTNSRKDISMICTITGDILHSKSDLSPECISLTYKFLKDLLELLPVVIIPGNHDLNMNNKERLDSLTPIICDLPQYYPIHYLAKTGLWLMNNILFSHASIFDYQIISPAVIDAELAKLTGDANISSQLVTSSKIYKVALYHGRVNGAQLFNGIGIDGEKDTISKKTITPSSFDGYDLALCGDIHKQQFFDPPRCTRGYAGSLIQQNLGEDLHGHGIIKWSLDVLGQQSDSPCGTFINIPNDYGYVSFRITDGKHNYDEIAALGPIPTNIRVRVLYINTLQSQVQEFIEWLTRERGHTVLEYSCQNAEQVEVQAVSGLANPDETGPDGEPISRREFDINNVEYQNQLLEEIIIANYNDKLAEGDLDTIKNLNRDANKLFNDPGDEEVTQRITLPGQRFKILRMEFDNLFSYGEGNVIDFSKCKGVVGIVAPNHMGKSAILDIILYGLFDKMTRKGNIKDMINNRRSSYRVKLVIQSGIWKYTITKTGKKTATGTSKNECTFIRTNISNGRDENLAKDTAKRTREYICEVFGNFEDMINTNFSIQTNSTGFIDAENSARRAELEKILRFDFLSDLAKRAGDQYKAAKTVWEHLQKTMPADRINTVVNTISENEALLIKAGEQRAVLTQQLTAAHDKINTLHTNINPDVDKRLDNLLSEVDMNLETQLGATNTNSLILEQVNQLENQKSRIKQDLDTCLNEIIRLCAAGCYVAIPDGTNITLSDEERTSHKTVKKWREVIKSVLKYNYDQIQIEKRAAEDLAKSVGVQITQLRQSLQRYGLGKPAWSLSDFNTAIDSLTEKIRGLENINDELVNKNAELDRLVEKCDKYRAGIEETRVDLDNLQSREQIPDFLKTEFSQVSKPDGDLDILNAKLIDLEKVLGQNSIQTNYPELKTVLLKLGWIQELGARVKSGVKADEKSVKYRAKIEETRAKLEKCEKKIKTLKSEIVQGQKSQTEYHKLKLDLDIYKQDLVIYNGNLLVLEEIKKLEAAEEEARIRSQARERTSKIDELKQRLAEYEDLDIRYKDTKAKLKTLGGCQQEMDELIVAAGKNNEIRNLIAAELGVVNELNEQLSNLDIRMEKYKDIISGLRGQLEKMREDCVIKVQKEKLMNIYAIYRDALKLIPILLISKVQPVIERKVNDLLSTITDFSVKFSMEENKIDIYLDRPVYEGEPILINNSSGFERFISSLAIRIALMEISQLPSPNFIAIDEGWSCFDNENIANMDVILSHLGQKFDFILTISHLQVIRQHCDIQIVLRRDDDGFSQVNYAAINAGIN